MGGVLVVDDDFGTCEVVTYALDNAGIEVHCIQRGNDVFNSIDQYNPKVILLDYLLQGVNGGELCLKIKSNPKTQSISIILISAYPIRFDPIEKYCFDAFIPKPFDLDDIVEKVNFFL